MKKYADYYSNGKVKYNGKEWYFYNDKNNYLFSKGIYKTKIKEEDLPDYYIKMWLYPRYEYLSLKNIVDIHYKPNFHFNQWRKDDVLYISYKDKLILDENGSADDYDVLIYGPEIDHFIEELTNYGYDENKLNEIKKLMEKKDKWYKYWDEHNWNGNYFFTSEEIWKEILGGEK